MVQHLQKDNATLEREREKSCRNAISPEKTSPCIAKPSLCGVDILFFFSRLLKNGVRKQPCRKRRGRKCTRSVVQPASKEGKPRKKGGRRKATELLYVRRKEVKEPSCVTKTEKRKRKKPQRGNFRGERTAVKLTP